MLRRLLRYLGLGWLALASMAGCATLYPVPDCAPICAREAPGSRVVVAECSAARCRCVCERPGDAQPFAGTVEARR